MTGGQVRDDDPFTNRIDQVIGQRLRDLRAVLRITQAEAGAAVGVSANRWKTHEDGERISASRLWKFCSRFEISVSDILADLPGFETAPATGVAEIGAVFADRDEHDEARALLTAMSPIERRVALAALRGIVAGRRPRT